MTSDPDQDLTLGQLLTRGIQSSLKVIEADSPNQSAVQVSNRPRGQQYSLHSATDSCLVHCWSPHLHSTFLQSQLESALSDLTLCSAFISRLGIFSPNETLDDIHTRDLRCLLVDALRGQLAVLAKTQGTEQRIQWLDRAKVSCRRFLKLCTAMLPRTRS